MPVGLYGCEIFSVILWEERGLRVFENMVSRKIFGRKREEVTGDWRKLHDVKLHDLYFTYSIFLGDQIKENETRGAGSLYEGEEKCMQCFGGEMQREELLGRCGRSWKDIVL